MLEYPSVIDPNEDPPEGFELIGINSARLGKARYGWCSPATKEGKALWFRVE